MSSYPPCPLCGGDAELDEYQHQVECTNCCMRGPSYLNEQLAEEGWERLASMVRLPPGVEQIAGSVDDDGLEELARWSVTGGFSRGWSKLVVTDEWANQTDGLTFQEACDQVRAELARLGGDDDE